MRLPSAEYVQPFSDAPNILIDQHRVFLDGQELASVAAILAEAKLKRVEALFEAVKRKREQFKAENPTLPFAGVMNYWIDGRINALVVKSIFQTVAFAGYPNGYFVVYRRGSRNEFGRLPADARVPRPPDGQSGAATRASGRLPPEVIQMTVRQNYAAFRRCYEQGLRRDPQLRGRVAARFVIDREGKVSNVTNGGSDLPDADVLACVFSEFYKVRFPAPEGGVVTVVYPIQFEPQ
jgi:hypothetical protein